MSVFQPGKIGDADEDLNLKFDQRGSLDWRQNSVWMAAMAHNYRDKILPRLDKGEWVIEDSSEIRALAMSLMADGGLPGKATESALRWLKSKRLTMGIIPGLRIKLISSPQECIERIFHREGKVVNLEQMQQLMGAYEWAWKMVRNIIVPGVKYLDLKMEKKREGELDKYFREVIHNFGCCLAGDNETGG